MPQTPQNPITDKLIPVEPSSAIEVMENQIAYTKPGISYGQAYVLLLDKGTGEQIAVGRGGQEHNQILFIKGFEKEHYRITENKSINTAFIQNTLEILERNPAMLSKLLEVNKAAENPLQKSNSSTESSLDLRGRHHLDEVTRRNGAQLTK